MAELAPGDPWLCHEFEDNEGWYSIYSPASGAKAAEVCPEYGKFDTHDASAVFLARLSEDNPTVAADLKVAFIVQTTTIYDYSESEKNRQTAHEHLLMGNYTVQSGVKTNNYTLSGGTKKMSPVIEVGSANA